MYLVIKIIGCILLVSATTLMGFKKAQRLYKRRDFINDFLVFLDTLATNIRYSTDELSIILSKSEDRFGKAIYGAYEKYDGTFFKKWKNAVADISDGYVLLFAQNEKTFRIKYKKCVFVKMYNVAKKYPRRKSKSAWVFSFFIHFSVSICFYNKIFTCFFNLIWLIFEQF